ncbi:hypothetical protein NW762_013187 [Fusarium torreyae]|uniref:Uncharacterized protein n=1 Tax=Fusarium torreyae TaxID=1237075 RepID=A0A9W8VAS1_9HYPO|nr:hypothetical protein NW762_013187 [Fusarium torreyae]
MSSFYRPSTKSTAQAATAKLTRAERAAQEESNLNILRASIERTLWCLDPDCDLTAQLNETMLAIRRHSLATLLSEKPNKSRLASPPDSPRLSLDDDSGMPDQIFESSSPLHRGQLPRRVKRRSGRVASLASEHGSPLRRDRMSRAGSITNLRRDQILPSIEKDSDHTSENTGSAMISTVGDTLEKEPSTTTKATSDMETCPEDNQSPTKKRPAADEIEVLPIRKRRAEDDDDSEVSPTKKRAVDDNNEPSPVGKRVRTWLSQLTGGYME